jgi:hypothetical protein
MRAPAGGKADHETINLKSNKIIMNRRTFIEKSMLGSAALAATSFSLPVDPKK